MYQFNYQLETHRGKPRITCIVPKDWFSKELPTLGGEVLYVDKSVYIMTSSEFVFEFYEESSGELSHRIINLVIMKANSAKPITYSMLWDKLITIRCHDIEDQNASNGWCIEVVLLNHFFGSFAFAGTGNKVCLDLANILNLLSESADYDFEFGVGEKPQDILPGMINRLDSYNAKCSFGAIFCEESKMLMAYYKDVLKEMRSLGGISILANMGVDNEKMLISVLVGR